MSTIKEIANCIKCHRQRTGRYYTIHIMRVVDQQWEKPAWPHTTRYGKNFYAPVESVREFYCNRCSWQMWLWFQLEPVLWFVAFLACIGVSIFALRISDSASKQILALVGALFIWIPMYLGYLILREIGARMNPIQRAEIVEFRMTQRKGSHKRCSSFYFNFSRTVGVLGEIVAFTTANRPGGGSR